MENRIRSLKLYSACTVLLQTPNSELWDGLDVSEEQVSVIQNAEKHMVCLIRVFRKNFWEVLVKRPKESVRCSNCRVLTTSHFGFSFRSLYKAQTCWGLNNVFWITFWCCGGASLCNVFRGNQLTARSPTKCTVPFLMCLYYSITLNIPTCGWRLKCKYFVSPNINEMRVLLYLLISITEMWMLLYFQVHEKFRLCMVSVLRPDVCLYCQ
jgi:hypothetical protein